MFLEIDTVQHVGSLDPTSRSSRASLEGPCLSVSVAPEDWERIARISGRTWQLSAPGALWLDACNLTENLEYEILDWAHGCGFIAPARVFKAWSYDSETDTWCYFRMGSREEAEAQTDEDFEDDDIPSLSGTPIDEEDGYRLTDRGMMALERWADPFMAEEGALILWAMFKLAPRMPGLAGIWWDEDHDVLALSCPRGGVLPGRLEMFEITDELGNPPPFRMSDEGFQP